MSAAIDKQLAELKRQTGELKSRLALPAYTNVAGEQGEALRYFLSRALQLSEASDLVFGADLGTPLFVLARVLCEDLFLCCWVAQSEEDAAQYSKGAAAESMRLVRIMLENGRGEFRHTSTHGDKTGEVLRSVNGMATGSRIKIEQLAIRLGLTKVYDLVFRPFSTEVHGRGLGLPSPNEEGGIFAALSAIVLLVKCIGLILDNRVLGSRATTADEIVRLLGVQSIAGR